MIYFCKSPVRHPSFENRNPKKVYKSKEFAHRNLDVYIVFSGCFRDNKKKRTAYTAVSYTHLLDGNPNVRSNVQSASSSRKKEILNALENGEITPEEALEQMKEN